MTLPPSPYDRIARIYDPWSVSVTEDVDFYASLAVEAGSPVVELGVGTGRIAVPTALAGVRVIGVDERLGIVWLRLAWGVRQEGGDQLTVWELFKVHDGQIHAVEAFMKILPVELRSGGW